MIIDKKMLLIFCCATFIHAFSTRLFFSSLFGLSQYVSSLPVITYNSIAISLFTIYHNSTECAFSYKYYTFSMQQFNITATLLR